MGSTSDELKKAYESMFSFFLTRNNIKNKIEEMDNEISLVNQCILKSTSQKINYPIIVGNILSRASITNIGVFPPYKITENCIYPLKYTVKKRFKAHRNYKKNPQNKVLYICTVDSDGISITSDDGYVWKGSKVWDEFKSDVGITEEFKNLEDFMVLNHPVIVKLIEEIGNTDRFENYVPLSKRKKGSKP